MSEYGLAKNLKISPSEARNYINSYFSEYPEVKEYMDKNVSLAKESGYATTMLGRKRQIRELSSANFNLRQFGERVAMNMPLQGSAADVIKLAMLGVAKSLKEQNLKSQLILQVHDELIIDALISEREQVKNLLVKEMENAVNLAVKLTVSVGEGKNWYEAK
jgi:DNA polymerase-1